MNPAMVEPDRMKDDVLRILLVADSEDDRIAFHGALVGSGIPFELTVRERPEDITAAARAGGEAFDLVVVDPPPGTGGFAAFEKLRAAGPLPPFVMLAGTGSEDLAVKALQSGMDDCIIKDPDRGYLRLLPLKLLEIRRRHEDRRANRQARSALRDAYAGLEKAIEQRTADLAATVNALELEIAERVKIEDALRGSERTLRALSGKIVETQENERRRIAKELHDSIGSSLAAIKFAIEDKLHAMRECQPGQRSISLEKIVGYIYDTIREVRRISSDLRPSMLDDLGLRATVEWHCDHCREMYADTRIRTLFDIDGAGIPALEQIVIYRVLQEALNNALKHSLADTVRVELSETAEGIRLCVADDGTGFDVDAALYSSDSLTGFGLRGMVERAEAVGGRLSIRSDAEEGTAVCLQLKGFPDSGRGHGAGQPRRGMTDPGTRGAAPREA